MFLKMDLFLPVVQFSAKNGDTMSDKKKVSLAREPAAVYVSPSKLTPFEKNARDKQPVEKVAESIKRFGFGAPILARTDGEIIAGHTRWQAALKLKLDEVPVRYMDISQADARLLGIADNRLGEEAEWNEDKLKQILEDISKERPESDWSGTGLSDEDLNRILLSLSKEDLAARPSLLDRFGVPPFSVLDTRQGYWQERKKAWKALGLVESEGREARLTYGVGNTPTKDLKQSSRKILEATENEGTSVFDPVLCEIAYRWFSPEGGTVLDPFAGGLVRGAMASMLGRNYVGVDLRKEQVEANRIALKALSGRTKLSGKVSWTEGDSREVLPKLDVEADLVFSCPPYADLEVYSDDPSDLSNMPFDEFRSAYLEVIASSVSKLKENRFAVFVVGEVREKKTGFFRSFVPLTIEAFEKAGARFYNEAILVTAVVSASLRAGKYFDSGRKLAKTHQNVLVFCKGDPKKATKACGEVDFADVGDAENVGDAEI